MKGDGLMLDPNQTTAALLALDPDMPKAKAEEKSRSLGHGVWMILLGLLFIVIGAGFALVPVFVLQQQPNMTFLLYGTPFAIVGLMIAIAASFTMSGEAAHASENFLVRIFVALADLLRNVPK
jgi:hypothetical protein